jgi:hypothetical protein
MKLTIVRGAACKCNFVPIFIPFLVLFEMMKLIICVAILIVASVCGLKGLRPIGSKRPVPLITDIASKGLRLTNLLKDNVNQKIGNVIHKLGHDATYHNVVLKVTKRSLTGRLPISLTVDLLLNKTVSF